MPDLEISRPVIHRAGDSALLVEFSQVYSQSASRAVLAFDAALKSAPKGVIETAPTVRSVVIVFDPIRLPPELLIGWCNSLIDSQDWWQAGTVANARRWEVPVVYGGEFGPHLDEAAELAGSCPDELVSLHCSKDQTVLCLGFSPGLVYLAELKREFAIPRLDASGKPVPAGSILVANRQTVIPATPIPTGWRRIGVTPFRNFVPGRKRPFLLSPGDTVSFIPVSESDAKSFAANQSLQDVRPGTA